MSSHESFTLWRLRVVADADPSTIGRVIERLQNLNVVPRRISAQISNNHQLHIEVDVFGLSEEQILLVAAKIAETTTVHHMYRHRLT
jgi:hypothetical protein